MKDKPTKCPVCMETDIKTSVVSNTDNWHIGCPKCGSYIASDTVCSFYENNSELRNNSQLISSYLRLQNENGEDEYMLSTYAIKGIINDSSLPRNNDIRQKISLLLQAIKRRSTTYGKLVYLDLLKDQQLAFASNLDEFDELIKRLISQGAVIKEAQDLRGYYLKLSLEEFESCSDTNSCLPSKQEFMISPLKPYSNLRYLREVIEQCDKGAITWIDKYHSQKTFDLISQVYSDLENTKKFTLITSINCINTNLRKQFKRLKKELENHDIKINISVITEKKTLSQFHDRWITDGERTFNIPSVDIVARGQSSEIIETNNIPPYIEWSKDSLDMINDWDKISKLIEE